MFLAGSTSDHKFSFQGALGINDGNVARGINAQISGIQVEIGTI